MVDFYPQKTVDELLVILASLQKRASEGVVYFTTVAGLQTQRTFQGAARTEVEIKRVLYSLSLRAPEAYENPYTQRIRRTRARYTFS
jgi:hypothetical protein